MKPIDDLLSRLRGISKRGEGSWFACCPAHDDRSPSLSISYNGKTIAMRCFAGCPTDDILNSIGMTFSDLYEDKDYGRAISVSRMLPKEPSRMDVHRTILELARDALRRGQDLSVSDQAQIKTSLEVLRATVTEGDQRGSNRNIKGHRQI